MSQRTLNQLIASVISGAEEEESVYPTPQVVRAETAPRATAQVDDTEKLASALEFIGYRGIESFFKTATEASAPPAGTNDPKARKDTSQKHTPANVPPPGTNFSKKASSAMHPPAGTNYGVMHKGMSGRQITSMKHAPPMKSKAHGKVEDNAHGHPGGTTAVDTSRHGHGTHHAALSSNEAAINASPTIKEKNMAAELDAVLDSAGPDANHQKMKMAGHDLDLVRAELARRAAGGRA
jgi:hypothetical protein